MLKKIYQIYKRVCTILSQIAASPQPPIPPSNSLTPTGVPTIQLTLTLSVRKQHQTAQPN